MQDEALRELPKRLSDWGWGIAKKKERLGRYMQEKEWIIENGSIHYEIDSKSQEGSARVTGFQGMASQVGIPGQIEGLPVTAVAKKAFLSRKNLRRVLLPDTVEEIGDWAFAYCDCLEEVVLPRRGIRFGKAVFMECKNLRRISAVEECRKLPVPAFPAELLAAAVSSMDAAYLLDLETAGTEEWLGKWDARLKSVLRVPDQEGFSRQILCGEEDYGSTDLAAYMSGRRKEKIRLSLLRLLFDQGLDSQMREELEAYLLDHTKGEKSEETWQVILQEHGGHRDYYRLFAEIGCVTERNLDHILADIGEEYPEMKAYFLRYREEFLDAGDFFAGLEL